MATLASIRSKLATKVFNKLGSDVTITAVTTSTDKWGDLTTTSTTSSTVTMVPYNHIKQNKTFNPFGVANEGEFDVIMPYTTTITVGMTAVLDSKTYDVFQVERFPYDDGNIAFLVRLREQLS